ncbi:MAG TPA: hypothetical protein VJI32_04255 [Candidatus Nanoarchaeia archaeon]|nr:hypothetical protein [Candidatus Nanoarchaeia archaeon]
MDSSSVFRRTNQTWINQGRNHFCKLYRDYPYTIIPQVLLGLRTRHALLGLYRCQTEQRKVACLQHAGFPLAQEYLLFESNPYEPLCVARYDSSFQNVEEKIRKGILKEEALTLVGKCAAQLLNLHQIGKQNGEITMTHGDPYLENMRYYPDNSVRLFDFEHDYERRGNDAAAMDGAIFVGHAMQVLRDCGHIKNKQDYSDVRDVIEQQYPGLRTDAPQGRMYLRLRFG